MLSLIRFFLFRISVVSTLTLLAASAFPQEPATREQALAGLAATSAEARAAAIVWFARHGAEADAPPLYERLHDENTAVRSYAEQALWLLWGRSGDAAADRLMERGTDEMQSGRHREAIATFTQLIRLRPAFAEGWNKRATALYLAGEHRRSLADCAEVLRRNPRHFGALSGAGLNHVQLEEHRQALDWFRRALAVNPNMPAVRSEVQRLEALLRGRTT